jgi:predicted esterase
MRESPEKVALTMRRNALFPWILGLVALLIRAVPGLAADLPRGTLIEKLTCAGHPDQAYALYLPSSYRPDRTWPILYAFDARGQALIPAKAFREAAETYGWILVSSYNSASDGPMEPNFTAMRALWAETHAHLAIDDKRVYAAGFSGTVRFACILGLSAPGSLAGVIGAGAGFPTGTAPKADNPFAFFGTVGDRDFNYYEMMDLDRQMEALHLPHRIEVFDGTHQWPPAALATQAVGWMELAAMRKGTREKVPAVIDRLWTADRERARSLEAAGRLWDAHHVWTALANDYAGLRPATDTAAARTKSEEIAAGETFKKQAKERQERIARDTKLLAEAPMILGQANAGNEPVTVSQIAAQLKIPQLKARAESSDPDEVLAAKRVLNTLLVQTTYYLPQMLIEKKDYDRAVFMLSIGAEIRPDDPRLWVEIAAAHARKGQPGVKKALEALHKAADKGLDDPAALENEPAFADLRQEDGYRQVLAQVRQRKAPSPPAPLPSPGGGAGGRWERGRG